MKEKVVVEAGKTSLSGEEGKSFIVKGMSELSLTDSCDVVVTVLDRGTVYIDKCEKVRVIAYNASHVYVTRSEDVVIRAHDDSEVEATNATIYASRGARVKAENSTVTAYDWNYVTLGKAGLVMAYKRSRVIVDGLGRVQAHDTVEVSAYGEAEVLAWDNSCVWAHQQANVRASNCATVHADGKAAVRAGLYATVHAAAHSKTEVKAEGEARVVVIKTYPFDEPCEVVVKAYNRAFVDLEVPCKVDAHDEAIVRTVAPEEVTAHDEGVTVIHKE